MENSLQDVIKTFMIDNDKILDQLLEDTYYYNFLNHNILSASSCVNYLLKISQNDNPVETPCQLMLRQAIQFYYEEGIEKVISCYYELINQDYVHASPTMFNACTKKNQMSSCFLLTLGDNLESLLYSGAGDVGLISKLQGGIGLSMNAIRHSNISTSGKSSGVLPFGKIYDATIMCVDQGGKRNGAMTITLNDWHIDFPDFIRSRDNFTQNGIRFKQANICAYLSNLFMERVKKNQKWTLFCPAKASIKGRSLLGKSGEDFEELYLELEKEAVVRSEKLLEIDEVIKGCEKEINSKNVPEAFMIEYHRFVAERLKIRKKVIDYKVVDARELYNTLCDMHNKSSMPYVVYRDPVNFKNNMKNIGPCEGLNLCLEITEPSTPESIASCNLGHVNLKKYVIGRINKKNDLEFELKTKYDFEGLGRATRSLVRNINKVIDYNYYPLDIRNGDGEVDVRGKISTPNFENRPIGIGVSGLAEVFALLGLPYDDKVSFQINKMIFACMYFNTLYESNNLAKDLGEYKNFRTGFSEVFLSGKFRQ